MHPKTAPIKEAVTILAERTTDPDGTITYKPVHISKAPEYMDIHLASKTLLLSRRRLQAMCKEGAFASARRNPQDGWTWQISRSEVLSRTLPAGARREDGAAGAAPARNVRPDDRSQPKTLERNP